MGKKVNRVPLVCSCCKKTFEVIPWMYRQKIRRNTVNFYCSMQCRDKAEVGVLSPGWKGGKQKHGRYIKLNIGRNKRDFEHRLIMENKIGRKLMRGEVVHHINGDPKDNRIENLVLCKTHGQHTKLYHPLNRVLGKFAEA